MDRILYESRCQCKDLTLLTQKRPNTRQTEGKPLVYPNDGIIKTFQIKYEKKLSVIVKFLLTSFQHKYLYYAIDDILYLLKANTTEQDNILSILYSPVLSLQNNFCVNFFDIWIHDIYITEVSKTNKFLNQNDKHLQQFNYITIRFLYTTRLPIKKRELLW
uniref:Uncharacterized protein n=1 Tax=Psammoneis obaidii TaxID=1706219 RepID=A0A2U9NSH1_9STRA|nr:hypothetical protein ycf88 [Psammoneis obaidii]AWT39826.1 hypothetical protein ycf88 [Psammoneis obaidii]